MVMAPGLGALVPWWDGDGGDDDEEAKADEAMLRGVAEALRSLFGLSTARARPLKMRSSSQPSHDSLQCPPLRESALWLRAKGGEEPMEKDSEEMIDVDGGRRGRRRDAGREAFAETAETTHRKKVPWLEVLAVRLSCARSNLASAEVELLRLPAFTHDLEGRPYGDAAAVSPEASARAHHSEQTRLGAVRWRRVP